MKTLSYIFFLLVLLPGTAQAQLSLHLLVNSTDEDTITAGEPLILELQLYHAQAEYASIHNNAVRENLRILQEEFAKGEWTEEQYQEEREILESSILHTTPVTIPATAMESGLQIFLDEVPLQSHQYIRCIADPAQDAYTLTGEARLVMIFGIAPSLTMRLSPDTHAIRIVVDTQSTNTVSVIVVLENADTESAHAKQIRLGYFHLDCGNPADALTVADRLLGANPSALDAVILKADTYFDLEDNAQALDWYRQALRLFHLQNPDSYELPEYLLDQIAALEARE